MKLAENFMLIDFRCKDEARTPVPEAYMCNVKELAKNLQVIRDYIKEPLTIISAYRTKDHNESVKGKINSQHLYARAADLTSKSYSPRRLANIIEKLIAEKKIKQGGIGVYPGFVHYDIRGIKARW